MTTKRSTWLIMTMSCLLLSIISMFLPVLTYVGTNGQTQTFNVLKFLKPNELERVLAEYTGSFVLSIDKSVLTILAVLAVLAIVAAFVGVITMSLQRPNYWQFVLAMVGLVGTMIPSILVYVAVFVSIDYFPGTFRFGAYPIVTPVTMLICMQMVTQKRKRTQAEIEAEKKAAQYFYKPTKLE